MRGSFHVVIAAVVVVVVVVTVESEWWHVPVLQPPLTTMTRRGPTNSQEGGTNPDDRHSRQLATRNLLSISQT
eukprot:scaffold19288_cov183-Amphora_coffeaeformis.AAC.1